MSEHKCPRCASTRKGIFETVRAIEHNLRIAERRPNTPLANGCLTKVKKLRQVLDSQRAELQAHLKGVA